MIQLLEKLNLMAEYKNLELDSLRNKIGLVSQDIFLFEGTVFENIAYGNLDQR